MQQSCLFVKWFFLLKTLYHIRIFFFKKIIEICRQTKLSLSLQKITSLQELKHLSCGILKIRCSKHLSKLIEKYFVGFTVSPLYALLKKTNKKQTIRRDISMDSVNYGQC